MGTHVEARVSMLALLKDRSGEDAFAVVDLFENSFETVLS